MADRFPSLEDFSAGNTALLMISLPFDFVLMFMSR